MKNRAAGYSLFEVLIAFSIMALVLAVLVPGQARLMGRVKDIDERALAKDYALSRLALLSVSLPLRVAETSDRYRDWQIAQRVTDHSFDKADMKGLYVEIIITNAADVELARAGKLVVHHDE